MKGRRDSLDPSLCSAHQRLRHKLEKQFGIGQSLSAESPILLDALTSRFASRAADIQKDLLACENAAVAENLPAREALALAQALHDDEALMDATGVPGISLGGIRI